MGEETLNLVIKAHADDHMSHSWPCCACPDKPIKDIARRWAQRYNILNDDVVGLEIEPEKHLDLRKTPRELGWYTNAEENEVFEVWAVPLDDKYDADKLEATGAIDFERPHATLEKGRLLGNKPASAATVEVVQQTANAAVNTKHPKPKVDASQAEVAKASEQPVKKAKVSAAPKENTIKKSNSQDLQASGDDPIEMAPNPKRAGTLAYDRYELYKNARTVTEAMQLGASAADIKYDLQKGYMKRRNS